MPRDLVMSHERLSEEGFWAPRKIQTRLERLHFVSGLGTPQHLP